jgi:hypothetical protein
MLLRKAGLLTCAGIAVFCAAVLTGCGGNNSVGPGANTTSRVRVFNALENVPNNAAIDILTSSTAVALNSPGGVAYGLSSNYMLVRAGNGVNANVYPTGTMTNPLASSNSIGNLDPHTSGSNNGTFTVAAAGVVGQAGNLAPQIIRFIDAPNTPPAGQALIRLINLAPNANSAVLENISGNPPSAVAIPGFPTNGIAYAAGSDYVAVTPIAGQSFNLNVFSGGQALLANAVTANFQAGNTYSIYIFGGGMAGFPNALAITQDAPPIGNSPP